MKELSQISKKVMMVMYTISMLLLTGCSKDDEGSKKPTPTPTPTKTLYELVSADNNLSTLKKHLDADTELKKLVTEKTAHTLFAPDNKAFEKVKDKIGKELNTVDPNIVKSILKYHLTQSTLTKEKLKGASTKTLHGDPIVGNADGTLKDAGEQPVTITKADIKATNGIMHVVNAVLISPALLKQIKDTDTKPIEKGTLAELILSNKEYSGLKLMISIADKKVPKEKRKIADMLADKTQKYTLFVVSNNMFAKILDRIVGIKLSLSEFIKQSYVTPELARKALLLHISKGAIKGSELVKDKVITMLSGHQLKVIKGKPMKPQNPTGVSLSPDEKFPPSVIHTLDLFKGNATNGVAHECELIQVQ